MFYQVNHWIPKLKQIVKSKEFKKGVPAGNILFSLWFHESKELFTKVVYGSSSSKPPLKGMSGFLKAVSTILSTVDNETYGSGIKEFLQEYVKNAPKKLKMYNEKNSQQQP